MRWQAGKQRVCIKGFYSDEYPRVSGDKNGCMSTSHCLPMDNRPVGSRCSVSFGLKRIPASAGIIEERFNFDLVIVIDTLLALAQSLAQS